MTYAILRDKKYASGRDLGVGLKGVFVEPRGRRPKNDRTLLNWGCVKRPEWLPQFEGLVLNDFDSVAAASNKLESYRLFSMHEVPTLDFTTELALAQEWLREGNRIFARTKLNASQGAGITIFDNEEALGLCRAPLFVKEYKKNREYRVHVLNGEVIDFAQKRKMGDVRLADNNINEVDPSIRNHDNGWVFTKSRIDRHEDIDNVAIAAVQALGLDFGAVDVLAKWKLSKEANEHGGKNALELKSAVVCEVNTAPSLSAKSTLDNYIRAFKQYERQENVK